MNSAKLIKRLKLVSWQSLRNIAVPAVNITLALLVVALVSKSLWGEYVEVVLYVFFMGMLANWGSKEQLLLEFAAKPGAIGEIWWKSFYARLFVAVFLLIPAFFLFPLCDAMLLSGLQLFLFHYLSLDALIVYYRKHQFAVQVELFSGIGLLVLVLVSPPANLTGLLIYMLTYFAIRSLLLHAKVLEYIKIFQVEPFSFSVLSGSKVYLLLAILGFLNTQLDLLMVTWFMDDAQQGSYHLLMRFVAYFKNFAFYILQPYLPVLYRSRQNILAQVRIPMFGIGAVVITIATIATAFVLELFAGAGFQLLDYVLIGFVALPSYSYAIDSYEAFQNKNPRLVVFAIIFSTFGLGVSSFIFVPEFGARGAIIAALIGQWMMVLFYTLAKNVGRSSNLK